jgi:hypothetical protein
VPEGGHSFPTPRAWLRTQALIRTYASDVKSRRVGAVFAAAAGLAAIAGATTAASRPRTPIRPVLGDWEGTGPHGLRLSFKFVRSGGHVVALDYALGLPTGCRSTGSQTWDAGTVPRIEYIPPGSVPPGPFPPLGPTQFEFIIPPTTKQPFPVMMYGKFSSPRRGAVSVASPTRFGCVHTGWPRTLRFALAAARRVRVADGLWTGTVAGPPTGMSGTVKIRVIDGGRIETDFSTSYACPPPNGGGGNFEIGPLPTVGYLIEAKGSIGGAKGTETAWSGRFAADGLLSGQLVAPGCGSPTIRPPFTARRTGS